VAWFSWLRAARTGGVALLPAKATRPGMVVALLVLVAAPTGWPASIRGPVTGDEAGWGAALSEGSYNVAQDERHKGWSEQCPNDSVTKSLSSLVEELA
jgi:hypothetical protein